MEKEPLLIAAGSIGSRKINGEDKPFLIIDNEMNIEKVFSASMRAQYVSDIFIRGDKPRLEYVLQSQIRKYNNSERTIKILPEKGCLIENIVLTLHNEVCHYPKPVERLEDIKWNEFFDYIDERNLRIKNINLIPSDTPLILPEEIDYLVSKKPKYMNLVAGATPKSYLDCLVEGLNFNYEESQMNFFTLYHQGISFETRINNFWGGSALFFDKNLWQLIQRGYTNRHIMVNNKKGRIKYFNSEKLRNMKNAIINYKDHLKDCAYSNREYKRRRNALYNLIFSFPLLHFQNKIKLLNPYIPYFRQEWINEMASRATGNRVCLWQTPIVGLLYDLDADKSGNSYDYEFVKDPKNFAHLRERQLKLYDKYLNLGVQK